MKWLDIWIRKNQENPMNKIIKALVVGQRQALTA